MKEERMEEQQLQGQQVYNVRPYDRGNTNNSYVNKIQEKFHIFGLASLLYAVLFAFCMYDNLSKKS